MYDLSAIIALAIACCLLGFGCGMAVGMTSIEPKLAVRDLVKDTLYKLHVIERRTHEEISANMDALENGSDSAEDVLEENRLLQNENRLAQFAASKLGLIASFPETSRDDRI